jgi:molybdate transport system substrate-binding protein
MRSSLLAGLVALALFSASPGWAADLVVWSSAALRSSMADVPARFEKATGNHVRFSFGTTGAVRDKVVAGEPFDVVILPPLQLDEFTKSGLVVAGGRVDLGLVRLGAAVKAGAKRPAIATTQEFKQALLDASSLAITDPALGGISGVYLTKLMQQFGIADAIKGKLKLYPDGTKSTEAAARGEVALALGLISEIKPVPGVDLVGALPEEVQLKIVYTAGLASKSSAPDAAKALIAFLASGEMTPVYAANGFDRP